jgi:hypothetical protein
VRVVYLLFLLLAAALVGGLYGALYDQLTYTVSREFFTVMRFPQFGIQEGAYERWAVAWVGFCKTWLPGLVLGIPLALTGLLHHNVRHMIRATAQAFSVTLLMAFLFGMIALWWVEPSADPSVVQHAIEDKAAFSKVVLMNNFSYIGGVIGMFVGLAWQVLTTRIVQRRRAASQHRHDG